MTEHLQQAMSGALGGFGGYLRCETCHSTMALEDPGRRVLGGGWPKCCGHTMRWWTQSQIDAGEVPPRDACCCCTSPVEPRDPDPWEGRLDGYCEACALARCDAYPGECRYWRS